MSDFVTIVCFTDKIVIKDVVISDTATRQGNCYRHIIDSGQRGYNAGRI